MHIVEPPNIVLNTELFEKHRYYKAQIKLMFNGYNNKNNS